MGRSSGTRSTERHSPSPGSLNLPRQVPVTTRYLFMAASSPFPTTSPRSVPIRASRSEKISAGVRQDIGERRTNESESIADSYRTPFVGSSGPAHFAPMPAIEKASTRKHFDQLNYKPQFPDGNIHVLMVRSANA